MGKRKHHASVAIEEITREDDDPMILIRGGGLRDGLAWSPQSSGSITFVKEFGAFLSIASGDDNLQHFCGVNLRNNSFLITLAKASRESSNEAILLKTREFYGEEATRAKYKLAELSKKLVVEHGEILPKTVMMHVEGIAEPFLSLLAEDARKTVRVQCTVSVIESIVRMCVDADSSEVRRKTPRSNRTPWLYPEVHHNVQRDTAYIRYMNADGKPKYASVKLNGAVENSGDVARVSEELHEMHIANHHVFRDGQWTPECDPSGLAERTSEFEVVVGDEPCESPQS
jgi:hypothetical protein